MNRHPAAGLTQHESSAGTADPAQATAGLVIAASCLTLVRKDHQIFLWRLRWRTMLALNVPHHQLSEVAQEAVLFSTKLPHFGVQATPAAAPFGSAVEQHRPAHVPSTIHACYWTCVNGNSSAAQGWTHIFPKSSIDMH